MLGPLYLSSVLKGAGYNTQVLDLHDWNIPRISADAYLVTALTPHFPGLVKALPKIRRNTNWVIIGGPHATVAPDECLESGFDQVVVGEGERAILSTLQRDDEIVRVASADDLDSIPFPDRGAINLSSYHYSIDGKRATSIMTARGCPFTCAFCCKTFSRRVRFRTSSNVLAEAQELKDVWSIEALQIYDDEFFINWRRDEKIIRGLYQLDMPYRCFARADHIRDDIAGLAADTGCYEVLIGVESGSSRILENVHKGTTREDNLGAIATLKHHGIRAKAALIVGLPGEDRDSLKETETFIEEAQPDDIDITLLQVYPGSQIWHHPELYDLSFDRHSYRFFKGQPGEYQAGVSTSSLTSQELVEARDYLEKKFKPSLWVPTCG